MFARRNGRFEAYKTALKSLSARTGTPVPSLLLSFGILHEITALVPLVGVFYGARTLGIGGAIIDAIVQNKPLLSDVEERDWFRGTLHRWVEEGDRWACRVGQRYGVFGFERRTSIPPGDAAEHSPASNRIAGDVANAVVAYGVTKAFIPLRIGVSLYLSPAFSRRVLDPLGKAIVGTFRRTKP